MNSEEKKSKTCFVIMPITTAEDQLNKFHGDGDHYEHVLECLFKPAIEKTGLLPIGPKARGTKHIHADIIRNIESSDMVLCDMSALNANVFFELGARTALNKPVCLVVDKITKDNTPFDLNMLNHHVYDHELPSWDLTTNIDALVKHLRETMEAGSYNQLWKFLSMSIAAVPSPKPEKEDKIDLLIREVHALRSVIGQATPRERRNLMNLVGRSPLELLSISPPPKGIFDGIRSNSINEVLRARDVARENAGRHGSCETGVGTDIGDPNT